MAQNSVVLFILNFFTISFHFFLSFNLVKAQTAFPAMYVIGDSLVDVGNNNYLPLSLAKSNYPHHGIDSPNQQPTGRFSNGRNAADFIADKLGVPSPPAYLSLTAENNKAAFRTGVSFASAAGKIYFIPTERSVFQGQTISLREQVDNFGSVHQELVQQLGSVGAQDHISKSYFLVVLGSSDISEFLETVSLRVKFSPDQYTDLMVNTLKEQLVKLYNFGARTFGFVGIGKVGCIPSQRVRSLTEECSEEVNFWSVRYNGKLQALLQEFKSEFQDINYTYFDIYTPMQNILQNPSAFGFSEIKAACCGLGRLNANTLCTPVATYCPNRRDHFFWDTFHPTEDAVRILVDAIFSASS